MLKRMAVLVILLILMIIPVSALSQSNFKVKIVSAVYGYDRYIPRWSNVFRPGQTLRLYLGLRLPNNNVGAVAIDFVILIKNPNGFVVSKKVIEVRKIGYIKRLYQVVDIPIGKDWLSGRYEIDAYAFDVLDYMSVLKGYTSYNVFTGKGGSVSIKTISRRNAPFVKKVLVFYVYPNAETTPPDKYIVFDSQFKFMVAPTGTGNGLYVSVLNRYSNPGTVEIGLKLDGRLIGVKTVYLNGYECKRLLFALPNLKRGKHKIVIICPNDHAKLSDTPPIFISPFLFDKPVLVGNVLKGCIIYSPDDYILGSVGASETRGKVDLSVFNETGYVMNRESAERMITNVLAYTYTNFMKGEGTINVALLKGSDERAEKVLPLLLEYVKKKTKAPVNYLGVRGYSNLRGVNLLIYVGTKVPDLESLSSFFQRGGVLFIDNPSYWKDIRGDIEAKAYTLGNWTGLRYDDKLYTSYYDLHVNKVVTVTVTRVMKPRIVYSDLEVSKFVDTVGTPVKISFKVKNIGGPGKVRVMVKINGKVVFKDKIFLKHGEEKLEEFYYTPKTSGSYRVQIVGSRLAKIFFVKGKTKEGKTATNVNEENKKSVKSDAGIVVASAAILAVLVIIRLLIRE